MKFLFLASENKLRQVKLVDREQFGIQDSARVFFRKFLFLTLRVDYRYKMSDGKQFYFQDFTRSFKNFFMKAIEYSLLVSITLPKQEEGIFLRIGNNYIKPGTQSKVNPTFELLSESKLTLCFKSAF